MTFPEFIRSHGIIPPTIIVPEVIHKLPTIAKPQSRNGRCKLFADGKVGWCQDHATMSQVAVWRADDDGSAPKAPLASLLALVAARDAKRRHGEAMATAAALRYWQQCRTFTGGHPYLDRKRVGMMGCDRLRVDEEGKIALPVMRGREFISLQLIDDEGVKKNWPGAPMAGGSHSIRRTGSTVLILCEGLATGLTLFNAMANSSVVCAFAAGNMVAVARTMRWEGMCVVAADNDAATAERIGRNPGADAARDAAEVSGAGLAVPPRNGDFNDLYCARIAEIEEAERDEKFKRPAPPRALQPVRDSIMRAAKFIAPK